MKKAQLTNINAGLLVIVLVMAVFAFGLSQSPSSMEQVTGRMVSVTGRGGEEPLTDDEIEQFNKLLDEAFGESEEQSGAGGGDDTSAPVAGGSAPSDYTPPTSYDGVSSGDTFTKGNSEYKVNEDGSVSMRNRYSDDPWKETSWTTKDLLNPSLGFTKVETIPPAAGGSAPSDYTPPPSQPTPSTPQVGDYWEPDIGGGTTGKFTITQVDANGNPTKVRDEDTGEEYQILSYSDGSFYIPGRVSGKGTGITMGLSSDLKRDGAPLPEETLTDEQIAFLRSILPNEFDELLDELSGEEDEEKPMTEEEKQQLEELMNKFLDEVFAPEKADAYDEGFDDAVSGNVDWDRYKTDDDYAYAVNLVESLILPITIIDENGEEQLLIYDMRSGGYIDEKGYVYTGISEDGKSYDKTIDKLLVEHYKDGKLHSAELGNMHVDAEIYEKVLDARKNNQAKITSNQITITDSDGKITMQIQHKDGATVISSNYVQIDEKTRKPETILKTTYGDENNVQKQEREQMNYDTNEDGKIDDKDNPNGIHKTHVITDNKEGKVTYIDYDQSEVTKDKGEVISEKITYDPETLKPESIETYENGVRTPAKDKARLDSLQNQFKSRQLFAQFEYVLTEFSGLRGFSRLIWDKGQLNEWRKTVDDAFCTLVITGGENCWVSKLCQQNIEHVPSNVLVIETPDDLIAVGAHVEAERSQPIISPEGTEYLYKITFVVNNPRGTYYKDLKFNLILNGERSVRVFKQDLVTDEGEIERRVGEKAIVQYSKFLYTEACLKFDRALGVVGGGQENEVCTSITEPTAPLTGYTPPPGTDTTPAEPGSEETEELVDF